jgi:hypothetical protein
VSDDHIKSEISAYLAGGLPELRNRQIEGHIAACEKCRQALTKARAKQARVKREALKKASADPLPNLFLARQGKAVGVDRPSSRGPWGLLAGLILAGAAYGLYRHFSPGFHAVRTAAVTSDPSLAEVSSAPIVSSAPASAEASAGGPAIASATAVTPVAAASEVPVPPPSPVILDVKQDWKGVDSGIKTSRVVVIRNWQSWEKLWAEMQGKEPLPPVNFDQYVVVCIFAGGRTPNASVHVGQIREDGREVIVPYSVSGRAVAASVPTVAASTSTVAASSSPAVAISSAAAASGSTVAASSHP